MKLPGWIIFALVALTVGCGFDGVEKPHTWNFGEDAGTNGADAGSMSTSGSSQPSTSSSDGSATASSAGATSSAAGGGLPGASTNSDGAPEGSSCTVTSDCGAGLECAVDSVAEDPTDRHCAPPRCLCADPGTTFCWQTDCALATINCTLDACPTNYDCFDGACLCTDDSCQGDCATDDQCDETQMCDQGTCRDAHCESDTDCPGGRVCGGGTGDRICRVPGDRTVGESCSMDRDCATGYCFDDTCVKPCLSNAECGGTRECACPDAFEQTVPYCHVTGCGCASDEYCWHNGTCHKDPCPGGHCDQETVY